MNIDKLKGRAKLQIEVLSFLILKGGKIKIMKASRPTRLTDILLIVGSIGRVIILIFIFLGSLVLGFDNLFNVFNYGEREVCGDIIDFVGVEFAICSLLCLLIIESRYSECDGWGKNVDGVICSKCNGTGVAFYEI